MKIKMLEVSKTISNVDVLEGISLEVDSGMVLGLQGVNGSGKTMIMRVIAGLVKPTKGSVHIDDVELGSQGDFPTSIGLLIESPAFLPHRTGLDNLRIIARLQGGADGIHVHDLLRRVGLDPEDRRRFSAYSLGMKQRLGIAAAFVGNPDIILLDEPTNALDSTGVKMVEKLIASARDHGAALIVASHDLAFLQGVSDVVITLAEGHIEGEVRQGETVEC